MTTKTVTLEIPTGRVGKAGATLKDYLARIDRVLERSRCRQEEIDRLQASTRAKLAELKAMR